MHSKIRTLFFFFSFNSHTAFYLSKFCPILTNLLIFIFFSALQEGRSGYTALHFACESGNVELVEYLLQYAGSQLDTETRTWGQLTAYQLAACNNNRYLMSAMEKCGAEALMAPDSDDDSSYFEDSDDEYNNYQSDDCELN